MQDHEIAPHDPLAESFARQLSVITGPAESASSFVSASLVAGGPRASASVRMVSSSTSTAGVFVVKACEYLKHHLVDVLRYPVPKIPRRPCMKVVKDGLEFEEITKSLDVPIPYAVFVLIITPRSNFVTQDLADQAVFGKLTNLGL